MRQEQKALPLGGGLSLALVVAVVNAVTLSLPQSTPGFATATQLQGFHIGLYVIIAFAVLSTLVALVGMRESPAKRVNEEASSITKAIRTDQIDAR